MITFRQSSQTKAAFDRIEAKIKELRQPKRSRFDDVRNTIASGFADNFATESAGGLPWQSLAPSTMKQRALLGYGASNPILVREDTYRSTFTDLDNGDHASTFEQGDGKTTVGEGSSSPIAAFHERGGARIPKRAVTPISSAARRAVGQDLSEIVREILNG